MARFDFLYVYTPRSKVNIYYLREIKGVLRLLFPEIIVISDSKVETCNFDWSFDKVEGSPFVGWSIIQNINEKKTKVSIC